MEYNHGTAKQKEEQQAKCVLPSHDQSASSEANIQAQNAKTLQGCKKSLVQRVGMKKLSINLNNSLRALDHSLSYNDIAQAISDLTALKYHLNRMLNDAPLFVQDDVGPHSWKPTNQNSNIREDQKCP